MPLISRSLKVPYQSNEMFDLVNDVEAYPEFLPWCKESEVISRDEDEVHATLHLAMGALHKSFTTCNRLQKDKMIEIRLLNGPFKHLEGFWRFDDGIENHNGCEVALSLEFEFAGKLMDLAIGPIFHQIAHSLVDAFSERAVVVYGKRS